MDQLDDVICRRVLIAGRVQGVGYRECCRTKADLLGVAGSVENRPDGIVVAVFEGRGDLVEEMIEWCRRGPQFADVSSVYVANEPPSGARRFLVR